MMEMSPDEELARAKAQYATMSAFPHWRDGGTWSAPGHGSGPLPPEYQPGMTLRDYFAASWIAAGGFSVHAGRLPEGPMDVARLAYAIADAMLAERAK